MCRSWRSLALLFCAWASAATAQTLLPVELAPGIHVIPAPVADVAPDNAGHVVNTGFIVTSRGVVVIDSGARHAQGEAILAAIRTVTPQPVVLLINTHPHPQNVLGNSAFVDRGIPILATQATREAMGTRCPQCLKSLAESVGAVPMAGTRIELPDRVLASERLQIGDCVLRLLHFGHGHTEGDLLVLDETSQILFTGDLVYRDQIPHVSESDTSNWLTALERTAELPFRILVPGRGAVGDASTLAQMKRYLEDLRQIVGSAYERGLSAEEAIALADLPEFSAWHGYAARHGRNVQHVYFEIERRDFLQPDMR